MKVIITRKAVLYFNVYKSGESNTAYIGWGNAILSIDMTSAMPNTHRRTGRRHVQARLANTAPPLVIVEWLN